MGSFVSLAKADKLRQAINGRLNPRLAQDGLVMASAFAKG